MDSSGSLWEILHFTFRGKIKGPEKKEGCFKVSGKNPGNQGSSLLILSKFKRIS